jgi:hypothetical protein
MVARTAAIALASLSADVPLRHGSAWVEADKTRAPTKRTRLTRNLFIRASQHGTCASVKGKYCDTPFSEEEGLAFPNQESIASKACDFWS